MKFSLAKSYAMHKSSFKISISKEKLTKHFKSHFSSRPLEMFPEVEHPESFDYLKDTPIEVNEAPECREVEEAVKTLKNGKLGREKSIPRG